MNLIAMVLGLVVLLGGGYFVAQKSGVLSGDTMQKESTIGGAIEDAMAAKDAMMKKNEATEAAMMQKDEGMTAGDAMMKDETMMQKDDTMMKGEEGAMMKSGSYETYSPEKMAAAKGRVLLYFHADWCPICRGIEADIKANLGKIPGDVTILKVNYDAATDLRQKYGVTYQHTFVQINSDGSLVKKWGDSTSLSGALTKVQ